MGARVHTRYVETKMKWRTYKWLLRALLRIGVWLGIPVVAVIVNPQAMQTGVMAEGLDHSQVLELLCIGVAAVAGKLKAEPPAR